MDLSPAARPGLLLALALSLTSFACPQDPAPAPAPAPAPSAAAQAAERAPLAPLAPPRRVYFLGHSLLSDVPDFVAHFAAAIGVPFEYREQNIPGASLQWQWQEAERAKAPGYQSGFNPPFGGAYFDELPKGTYDAVVLVDSVPRGGAALESDSVEYLVRLTEMARKANPKVRVLFYEPWHCIHSGTAKGCEHDTSHPNSKLPWRERLAADGLMWERIVAAANAKLPEGAAPIEAIPMARALGRLADAIEAGEVEGFRSWQQLFADDIHLTHPGKFFAGLVTYTALYQRAPDRMPIAAKNRWGGSYWDHPNWQGEKWPAPSANAARAMERVAAEVLQNP